MISCLMAAHNASGTIAAAVQSVLEQTRSDLELIVVDDGSTDDTAERVAAIADPRIALLHQSRRGPSAARNHALAHARGEYVAVIDADDVWLPQKLELQVQALARRADAALAYGWTDFVGEDLQPLHPDGRATVEGQVLAHLLRLNFICCGSNTLIRRAAMVEVGGFDEALEGAEDWELHTRLAARHAFVAVPQVVVRYRRSSHSLSSRFWLMERNFQTAARKIFATVPPELRPLLRFAKASFYRYLLLRTLESEGTDGKWKAVPRYAALAAWYDPLGFRRAAWQNCAAQFNRGTETRSSSRAPERKP